MKKGALPPDLQLELDLIEERIITDPDRTYQRRYVGEVIYDASGYDEHGLEVSYLPIDHGDGTRTFKFLGFTVDTDR